MIETKFKLTYYWKYCIRFGVVAQKSVGYKIRYKHINWVSILAQKGFLEKFEKNPIFAPKIPKKPSHTFKTVLIRYPYSFGYYKYKQPV